MGWTAFSPPALALVAAAIALAVPGVAQARDGATIVDSGSTNTAGYRIDVWSDGSATIVLESRPGTAASAPKAFTISQTLAKKFFADLSAARAGRATSEPCMKSASFGTSTHVHWHGWTSPDLDCPPGGALATALVSDAGAIRKASGVEASMPLRRGLIPVPQSSNGHT